METKSPLQKQLDIIVQDAENELRVIKGNDIFPLLIYYSLEQNRVRVHLKARNGKEIYTSPYLKPFPAATVCERICSFLSLNQIGYEKRKFKG